ncbi:hypothetical protein C7445_1284 [Alicyclobacillus sacchari]|uniref:Uncharacterized protein n=1 Tax=Alicyclobacillus sacchari TaxID=392010 RepID=A0A4R8LA76_9BACL|nr:hypothetical protein [Alicyclobacillus sacchari]TDY38979.1 hypothetical protein C7445_1284 [Alicyclobacillus sacchari]
MIKELQRQFLSLTSAEKLEQINNALKVKPLKEAVLEVTGCSVTWLREHMESLGYRYNRQLSQYVPDDGVKSQKTDQEELQGLLDLLAVKDQLLAMVGQLQPSMGFDFRDLYQHGAVVTRSLKTYSGIMEQFDAVCDRCYPQYRKQDLIGFALLEFVRKYGKESVTN